MIAVEPLEEIRAELERSVPGANALAGTAEAIPLADGTVDAVTCAQAFHWFDVDRALGEMWRVLRPGGAVGLVWNIRDESDPLQLALSSLIGERVGAIPGEREAAFAEGVRVRDALAGSALFGEVAEMACPHEQLLTREQVVERIGSMSLVAVLEEVDREQMLERIQDRVGEEAEPICFSYVTEAYTFTRLD